MQALECAQLTSTHGRSGVRHRPMAKWPPRQGPVVVLRLSRNLDTQPGRPVEGFVLMPKLDLGNDKTCVLSRKYVHVPLVTAPRNREARLFDHAAMTQGHESLSV